MSIHVQPISRRQWLALGMGGVLSAKPALSHAHLLDRWLPYPAHQISRIDPILRDFEMPQTVRIEPRQSNPAVQLRPQKQHGQRPPLAYVRTGQHYGVDPWLLFGVALQESKLTFGSRVLPYPWTLCVRGKGLRYADYGQTLQALRRFVRQKNVTNVDCGAMQVNWHWHKDKLGSFERALDPYPNLAVGARILRDHYVQRQNWRKAVALYHTGSDSTAETRQRGDRYAQQTLERLARMGIDVPALLATSHRSAAHA